MRQYFEDTKPITDRNGSLAMKAPLKATKGPDGHVCTLTQFTEAFRRGDVVSDPTEQEREAISLYLVPAVNALIDEALLRSGASIDDLQQERNRRRGIIRDPSPSIHPPTPQAGDNPWCLASSKPQPIRPRRCGNNPYD